MARLMIRLLGPVQVTLDGQPVTRFESEKGRALLAYLVAEPERPHRREALAEMLWPGRPEGAARANLRHSLAHLRQVLGDQAANPPFLLPTRHTIRFNAGSDAWIDATAFSALLSAQPPTNVPADHQGLRQLEEAVRLYRGPFLENVSLADSAAFEEWRVVGRERFSRLALHALVRLANGYEWLGEYERALTYARQGLDLEPWDEMAHQQVMRLLARSGRRTEALAQYETCRHLLAEELGVEPAAETTRLYEQIQQGELEPEPAARSAGPPVHIWNLPASPTPFFGRTDELAALEAMLANPATRLVTLTGPGGSGKTRLALEAGARVAQRDRQALADGLPFGFRHGAVFVPLAAIDTVEGLMPALAEALGLRLQGGQEQLIEALRRKEILLILDNLEHLLAGVELLAEILRTAPGVQILATSRERLQLQAECMLALGGLVYPEQDLRPSLAEASDPDAWVAAYPALQLLVESARRVQPHFALSPEDLPVLLDLCRQVDGLPLALELAASWADTLSLSDILAEARKSLGFLQAEWRDAPERHRSMRAVFDVSWRRLSGAERAVFSRLSVFRGGFSQNTATQVAGPEANTRTLAALVRKSFLQFDLPRDRYQIHELLRQYGALHLAEEPEQQAEAFDRHSRHFCAWMQSLGADLRNRRQNAALAQLGADLDNARAACLWAAAQGRADLINQAVYALGWYYYLRGASAAGEVTFHALVQALVSGVDRSLGIDSDRDRATARLCLWRSHFVAVIGDDAQCDQFARESLAILDSPALADRDVRSERAHALMLLGFAVRDTDPEESRIRFRRSHQLYEEIGDPLGMSDALEGLGRATRNLQDFGAAQQAAAESLRLRQEAGDAIRAAHSTLLLGHIALWQGEFARAEHLLRQGLTKLERSSFWLSHSLLLAGRFEEARAVAADTIVGYTEMGQPRQSAYSTAILGQCYLHLGDYGTARVNAQDALALAHGVDFARGVGMSLGLQGAVALAEGDYEEARTQCEASLAVWQQSWGHPSEFEGELACLGLAAWSLGNRDEAQGHLRDQLAWAQESQMLMPALFGLVATARLLADEGQIERAVELYAVAAQNPFVAHSRWFEDVAGSQITALAANMPEAAVTAARQRGQARSMEATVEELLTELCR